MQEKCIRRYTRTWIYQEKSFSTFRWKIFVSTSNKCRKKTYLNKSFAQNKIIKFPSLLLRKLGKIYQTSEKPQLREFQLPLCYFAKHNLTYLYFFFRFKIVLFLIYKAVTFFEIPHPNVFIFTVGVESFDYFFCFRVELS